MSINLVSPAFEDLQAIPPTFTCDGGNASPSLSWSGGPPAAEYVLIVTDPDAPGGTFVHWILFGIPGSANGIAEDSSPAGAIQGSNEFGQEDYGGPCPPGHERHRYVFTLYALRRPHPASVGAGATASELLQAVNGTIEAVGRLRGTYRRPG
jgi:Raf kinase inhibitor-like YbhB/YbcL family protein